MDFVFGFGNKDFFEPLFFISFIVLTGFYGISWLAESTMEDERKDSREVFKHSKTFHLWSSYFGFVLMGSLISIFYFNYQIGPIWYFIGVGFCWHLGSSRFKNRK